MARLPIPGSDDGTWGTILNNFLDVSHNQDGTLIPSAVASAGAEQTINKGKPNGYAALDASTNVPRSQLNNAPVQSVNSKTGTVSLTAGDVGADVSGSAATVQTNLNTETTRAEAAEATKLPLTGGTMTGPIIGFEDQGGQVYNVKAYGAKGDGVTDDTAAIQAAINACQSNGYGGIVFIATGGRYLVSDTLSITGQNVHIIGPGWSMPKAEATNSVSLGTPLAVLTPTASFPPGPVVSFNNTSSMINGCSIEKVVVDGAYLASGVSGVQGIHFGNAAFFTIDKVIITGTEGSAILIDQAGATYSAPSTSQMILKNIWIYSSGLHGIEFAPNLFISEVFIHDFWITGCSGNGIRLGKTGGGFDIHIYDGAVQGNSTGIYCGMYEVDIHDNMIYGNWDNGIEFDQTANYGYMSQIHHNIMRDNDHNTNGSAGIMVDTGSYDLIISDNICEKVNVTPEYGIVVVDGANDTVHNIYLRGSNYCVGNSVANYKSGTYEVTATHFSTGPQSAPTIPASGTALTNPFPFDTTVYVAGGTVTAIAVGGTATGLASGAVFVPAGETITLTYSAAPTWVWIGN